MGLLVNSLQTMTSLKAGRRARLVPDRTVNEGDSQSLTNRQERRLTCNSTAQRRCTSCLRSWYRIWIPHSRERQLVRALG